MSNEPTQENPESIPQAELARLLANAPPEERLAEARREAIWRELESRLEANAVSQTSRAENKPESGAGRSKRPKAVHVRRLVALAAVAAVVAGVLLLPRPVRQPGSPATPPGSLGQADIVRGRCVKTAEGNSGSPVIALAAGAMLQAGDRVRVGPGAGLHLILADGSRLWLCADTEAVFAGPRSDTNPVVRLLRGEIRADIAPRKEQPFRLQTPTATVRVLGTRFHCRVMPAFPKEMETMNRLREALNRAIPTAVLVTVLSGSVAVETSAGEEVLQQAQRTVVTAEGVAPPEPVSRIEYTNKFLGDPGESAVAETLMVLPVRASLIQSLWAINIETGAARHVADFVGVGADVKQRFGNDLALVDVTSVLFAHFGNEPIGGAGRPFISSQVFLIDLKTGEKIPMVPLREYDPLYMDLSPDRRKLAFVGRHKPQEKTGKPGEDQSGIFVLDLETFEVRQLLVGAMKTCPHWSPDSRWLAVSKAPGYTEHHDIVLIDTITGEVIDTELNGAGVYFTPDGKQILYTGGFNQAGSWSAGVPTYGNLYLADVPQGEPVALTSLPQGGALFPTFSPDGTQVAYWAKSPTDRQTSTLHVADPATGADREATTGNAFSTVQWLDAGTRILVTPPRPKNLAAAAVKLIDLSTTPPAVTEITPTMPSPTSAQLEQARTLADRLYRVFVMYREAVDAQDMHRVDEAQQQYGEARDQLAAVLEGLQNGGTAEGSSGDEPADSLRLTADDLQPYLDAIAKDAALTPVERSVKIVRDNLQYVIPSILRMYVDANKVAPPNMENLAQWAPLSQWQINHIRSSDRERVRRIFVVPGDDPDKVVTSYRFEKIDEKEGVAVVITPVLANDKRLEATYRGGPSTNRGLADVEIREVD